MNRYHPPVTLYGDSNSRVLSQCQLYVLNKGKKKKKGRKKNIPHTHKPRGHPAKLVILFNALDSN